MLNVWLQRRTVKHRATNQAAVFEALGYISSLCPTYVLKSVLCTIDPSKKSWKYMFEKKNLFLVSNRVLLNSMHMQAHDTDFTIWESTIE